MAMRRAVRKVALTVHLTCSVGWIGAAFTYLAFGIAAGTSESEETVRAAWTAMELSGWYVIVPLALLSLLTGIVMALGTQWGLFRHYWVVISLVLTALATAILVLHMPTVTTLADTVRRADDATLERFGGDLLHPGLGVVVLLIVQGLNVFKPVGLTRYGRRRQRAERSEER